MNTPAPARSTRLPGLDGLRAIAVLSVIAYHFLPDGAAGGFVGVDVFFVISGFLITGLLVKDRADSGRIRFPAFWRRRARRLLPALALVVLVCSAAALLVGGDILVRIGWQVLGAATFSSNWIFIVQGGDYFAGSSPELFRNLWSLAVEEQFYLAWPLLLAVLLLVPWRAVRVAVVGALAVASAVLMATLPADPTRLYFGTDTHSFGLFLGAAVALLLEGRFVGRPDTRLRRALPVLGAVALVGMVVMIVAMPDDDPLVFHGGLAALAVLTVVAVVGATTTGSWLGRTLDAAPLAWIGERSYGLYLWHWPVLLLLVAALPHSMAWWVAPTAALVITFGAAALSYRFVETPVRRAGLRGLVGGALGGPRPRRVLSFVAAAALVAAVGGTAGAVLADPGKSEAQLAVERGMAAIAAATPVRQIRHEPTPQVAALTGDQIYAIGDSVMLAASPWLQERYPGIAIDASVSRSMWVGPDIVQSLKDSGQLRPVLIVGLATNGDVEPSDVQAIIDIAGPDTLIVLVNGQAPQPWIPVGNATVATFARVLRNVELANWHDAIAPRIDELASDEVHPGGPISGGIYVSSIVDALDRLAELPPLPDDYRGLLRPV